MTAPFNEAKDGSHVGVQAQNYESSVTYNGDVHLTVTQDAAPEDKYRVGVENLRHGNAPKARELIWEAMMSGEMIVTSEVVFHWLVAMLSGRTVRHFSSDERKQLKRIRSRYCDSGDDGWADGVRLIYQLIESGPKTDMSLLLLQLDMLQDEQRDLIQPNLELFVTGQLKDDMWQRDRKHAQENQLSKGRLARAWMFFHPDPAKVRLPAPQPDRISVADLWGMRVAASLFVATAGYLGWELLWHTAFLGLFSYAAAMAGTAVAMPADRDRRFLTEQRRRKDEQFAGAPSKPYDELTRQVQTLFTRYYIRYLPDKTERERWQADTAGFRRHYQDEIVAACLDGEIQVNEVAWYIRYQVRQLKRRWLDGTLHDYRQDCVPQRGTVAARWAGLAVLVLGGAWALVALRAYVLADLIGLASAFWAWRCWLRIGLTRARHEADVKEHAERQEAIDAEFDRWSKKLLARPGDQQMATWLGFDRTVLLGMTLDHFQRPRSRLSAHAFLEEPAVAAKRAQIAGGPWRYNKYRVWLFLLAEDGVRVVRAELSFSTGTLTIRERTSYRYDMIVSVRVLRQARRQTFELRLTAGDPITVRLRDAADTGPAKQDLHALPAAEDHEEDVDVELDVTSVADLLYALEGVAGDGAKWFNERDWDWESAPAGDQVG